MLIVGSFTGVVSQRATLTEDSISPTVVDYHSNEDDLERTEDSTSPTDVDYHPNENNLESVVAYLMDHDAFTDNGPEDDVAMAMEDVEDSDVEDLTSALGVAQFFQNLEDNIEWGGYEYDHNREAMVDSDDDSNDG